MIFKKPITIVIFLACIYDSIGQISTDRVWKTNCFKEADSGRCEDSWIKISSDYYVCDLVIELEAPPKRIGYVNGNILTAVGSQTFIVQNDTLQPMTVRFSPPRAEVVDKRDNKYYAAEGTTYMVESETKKDIEILTTREYSVNQLAFDQGSNRLLILSLSTQSETNERTGTLFSINTETINVENYDVQAEKVHQAGDSITAMAVEGNVEKLLLGTRTPQGGKLIRLTKQEDNPCSENAVGKTALVNVIKEIQDKLLKVFDDISLNSTQQSQASLQLRNDPGVSQKSFEMENIRLKRELLVATTKLNSFTAKLFHFNSHLKSVQRPRAYVTTTAIPHYGIFAPAPLEDKTPDLPEKEPNCVDNDLFNEMAQKVKDTERDNQELKKKLEDLSLRVEDLLNETNLPVDSSDI